MMEKYYYNGKNVAIINVLQVGNDFDVRKLKLFNTRREAEEYAVGCILEDCEIIFDCYWQPNGLLVVRVCVLDERGEVYDIDKNIKVREIWYVMEGKGYDKSTDFKKRNPGSVQKCKAVCN